VRVLDRHGRVHKGGRRVGQGQEVGLAPMVGLGDVGRDGPVHDVLDHSDEMDQRGGVVQFQEGNTEAPGGRPDAARASRTTSKDDAGRTCRPGSLQELDGSGWVGDGGTDDEIAAKVGRVIRRLGDDDVGDGRARSRHQGAEDPAAQGGNHIRKGDYAVLRWSS
jgi:hypothetical protein